MGVSIPDLLDLVLFYIVQDEHVFDRLVAGVKGSCVGAHQDVQSVSQSFSHTNNQSDESIGQPINRAIGQSKVNHSMKKLKSINKPFNKSIKQSI